ncbi:MAG: ABC transporter transmembrane domain-containing protein [Sulfurimonadaceae bacterium]|nr:ABC transporter transmembrane domain-containing protein [Sulfurimonadaceae bacterium]
MKSTLKRYIPLLKDYKLQYFFVLIGIVLVVGATMATAHIMKPLMDDMFISKKESMLILIPLMLIGIYVVKSIGRYIQSVATAYIGGSIIAKLRDLLLTKMINLDIAYLHKNRSGEMISRITSDADRIRYFVSNMLPDLLQESLTVIGLVGYVIYLNPKLAFYSLVLLPLTIYPIITISKKLKKYSHRSQEKIADVTSKLTEVFNNTEIIKANESAKFESERFSKLNWQSFKINMKQIYVGEIVSPVMELVGAGGLAAVIFFGGREVYNGTMSVGEFSAFLTAVGLVFQPLRRVSSIYSKVQDALAASERVFNVLDTKNTILDGTKELKDDIKEIRFSGVKLKYENSYALNGIDITLKQGQKVALVGDSGGGKSTFINMLLRFYDPDEGVVSINGEDIKNFRLSSLRHHISLVTQRVYIFADTLASNVSYAQDIDEQRVKKALQLADASGFVDELEDGIDTKMEEFGVNLSGGQRQRIAIARAIYKHSSLILFDEATAALDNESEKRIQKAIDEYTKDKITITIAHRLSTIQNADIILVMQKGKIVASGTHNELLKSSDVYKRLSGELK